MEIVGPGPIAVAADDDLPSLSGLIGMAASRHACKAMEEKDSPSRAERSGHRRRAAQRRPQSGPSALQFGQARFDFALADMTQRRNGFQGFRSRLGFSRFPRVDRLPGSTHKKSKVRRR